MRRLRPAVLLAVLAVIGGLLALVTSAPPGVTLRAETRTDKPLKIDKGEQCFPLAVLPDETRGVRVNPAPGNRAPAWLEVRAEGVSPQRTGGATQRNGRAEYRLPREIEGDHRDALVCTQERRTGVVLLGEADTPAITLLGAPRSNWFSALPLLVERASFGRGTLLGIAALPLALLAIAAAWFVGLRAAVCALRRDGPDGDGDVPVTRPMIVRIAAVAALFGAAFALTTPPIQAPDEMVHLHYSELLADRQALPQTSERLDDSGFSPQLSAVMGRAAVGRTAFSPDRRPPWTTLEDDRLDDVLKALPAGGSRDSFTNASGQPPAYYTAVAVATSITGGSVLDRLLVARLLSALLFAVAVAGAVVFAREAVPSAGGLVVAGGMVLACLPIVGFIGGSVNPDAAMFATASWTLALLAIILRRGVTVRRGLLLGLVVGLGVLSKLTFLALLPAVLLVALVVLVRAARAREFGPVLAGVAAAIGTLALVALPYLGWAVLSGRGIVFGPPEPGVIPPAVSLRESLVYMFELYVGQVGPVADRIPGSGPLDIWAAGLVGKLGWLDYGFPRNLVLAFTAGWVLLLLGALLGVLRSARRRRAIPVDFVVYAVAALGVMYLIARSALYSRMTGATGFEQARYLLPVAAIGVGGVALALRQLPRPAWREWAASAIVVIALAHGTAAFFLTVGRYFA